MAEVCASRTNSKARQGCRALQVFASANEFLTARQGCRALQVFAYANGFYLRLPRAINRPHNDRNATPFVIAKPVRTLAVAISNHPICTNLFVSSVCRFAERHAGSSCPTNSRTHPRRRARPLGAPVQELPNPYKFARLPRPYIINYVRGGEHLSHSLFTILCSLFTTHDTRSHL